MCKTYLFCSVFLGTYQLFEGLDVIRGHLSSGDGGGRQASAHGYRSLPVEESKRKPSQRPRAGGVRIHRLRWSHPGGPSPAVCAPVGVFSSESRYMYSACKTRRTGTQVGWEKYSTMEMLSWAAQVIAFASRTSHGRHGAINCATMHDCS